MGNLSLDSNEATPLPGLADHYLCLTPADPKSPVLAVTKVGEPTPRSVPGGTVGATEHAADPKSPVSESLIARLTIAEQNHSLGVGDPKSPILARNGVLQDLFHKPLVPYSRGKGHH